MELSKKDKRVARAIIEKGLQVEFAQILNEAKKILEEWKSRPMENREAYHLLFKSIYESDKHIAQRYDGMSGSKYVFILAAQLADGVISTDDLKDLSEEAMKSVRMLTEIK